MPKEYNTIDDYLIDVFTRLEKTKAWYEEKVTESEEILNRKTSKDYSISKQNSELNDVLSQLRKGPEDGFDSDSIKDVIKDVQTEIRKLSKDEQKKYESQLNDLKKFWGINF